MNGFINDLRFGLRQLAAKPGFATAAILTLALGIGANTAVFSFLSGYLLRPLPYPGGASLAEVATMMPKVRSEPLGMSLPFYRVVKAHTDAFASTAYYSQHSFNLTVGGRATQVNGYYASASLFDVLSVKPHLGRTFTTANMHRGNDRVAVISYGLWRSAFGGDPDVVGKRVRLDGDVWKIIAVMPRGFAFPARSVGLWVPGVSSAYFAPEAALNLRWSMIGRLKRGVSREAALAQVQQAVSSYVRQKLPAKGQELLSVDGFAMSVHSLRSVLLGDRPLTLWLLQSAVLLILLITCVNVANLLLSRILGRSHEIAMRSTLGATRLALARQLLSEALCLTVPGGLIGAALAWGALHFMTNLSLGAGDSVFSIMLDWRVGLFALGMVLVTSALVSILPIRHLAKTDLQLVLQESSRTSGGGRRAKRIRNGLVVTELTFAAGLLAVAGLLLHSFMNLKAVDTGFRTDHVLMARLLIDKTDNKALNHFYADLINRVNALPGVEQTAVARILPLMGAYNGGFPPDTFTVVGEARPASGEPPSAMINLVSPQYFTALGIPVLRGRPFDSRDANKPSAIIDARIARRYFHGGNAIGRQIDLSGTKYTIVGIVPSVKYKSLSASAGTETIYLTHTYGRVARSAALVIHTALSPRALIHPLKGVIADIGSDVALYDAHTMHEQFAVSLRDKQTTMVLLLTFGGIALALAIVGIYAVMSYAVEQRRAECGVRLALGALPENLSWMILKDGIKLLAVGLVTGLGLAVLFGYLLSARLFGVAPFDPATLIGSAVVLCVITLVACWLPAHRAAKLDPAIAMMEQ
ncbi:MAG TPA: ABC transporter permease [Gammaproteobacteria bacterium]|nr:ABC transporter permease [Gammaproteobacteria bacterium]